VRAFCLGLGAIGVLAACDDDPTAPQRVVLEPVVLNDTIIGRQEALRFLFDTRIDPRTALDPENVVVTNLCTGLRITGALRVGTDSAGGQDTLIFSPSQTIPFVTPIIARVQNILTLEGQGMANPFLLRARTENPPVADVSWEERDSPTQDNSSGIFFLDRDRGFYTTITGTLYRTNNSALQWEFLFKSAELTNTRNVRAATADSLYITANTSFFATQLLRSVDSGRTFTPLFVEGSGDMQTMTLRRLGGLRPVLFIVGNIGRLTTWRWDENTSSLVRFGPVAPLVFGQGGDLSPDGSRAAAVGFTPVAGGTLNAAGYVSSDSGKTFTQITNFPSSARRLRGAGFIDDTEAVLLGDSSTVLRFNASTGTITPLGAAEGIPQRTQDPDGTVTTYHFKKAQFAPNDRQIGWIIGFSVRDRPVGGDIKRGVILMTRDGGLSWTQQAVEGADENGLGFSPLGELTGQGDLFVLANDFAVTAGDEGFIAARLDDIENVTGVCLFTTP
jgi:photosystem II stability/assembly factor-like uncharacterized protein